MGADRYQRLLRGAAALVLAGLSVLLPSAAAASPRDANGTTRVAGLTFSTVEFDPNESFTWTVRGVFVSGDECRVRAEGASAVGWGSCDSLTGSHTFTTEGEKWWTVEVRSSALGTPTVLTRLLVVDVVTDGPSPVKFNNPQQIAPITFASPQPVTVPTPVPVRWKGCDPVTGECPTGGGFGSWTDDDSDNLAAVRTDVNGTRVGVIGGLGFALFALGGLLVIGLPMMRGGK